MREHTAPWECMYAKEDKSKCKPGKKPKFDKEYFEILCLCILQSGLIYSGILFTFDWILGVNLPLTLFQMSHMGQFIHRFFYFLQKI
jgi:hypothetical protein